MSTAIATELDPIHRLTKDLKDAARTLSPEEARYLVDYYYQMQHDRIRAANQVRAQSESGEPHAVLHWLGDNTARMESNIKRALQSFADANPVGRWSLSIVGIGPVIASGLLAHIDIEKAPTVGHIWRFAGLDPTVSWGKGEKRPWNARLKVVCFHIGESFVKVKSNKNDFYGKFYDRRYIYETERNDAGGNAEAAAKVLATKRIGKDTDAYKAYAEGRLPKAQIHARAKRWAVKLFLAHWHHVAYRERFGEDPPKPFVISHMGHADLILPPNY